MEASWAAGWSAPGGTVEAEEGDPCGSPNWAGMEPVAEGRPAVAQWVDLSEKENKGYFSHKTVTLKYK